MNIKVDIYERRDFLNLGPTGCNMCAGVISESLIQSLSIEGIDLPDTVVQRGIKSFVLHTDAHNVTMYAPFKEMRIATVYRGSGPKGAQENRWRSFDGYLLELAVSQGAKVIQERVTDINCDGERPQIQTDNSGVQIYDLIVGAIGVNSPTIGLFEKLGKGYKRPNLRKTFNAEFNLGSDYITKELGHSMHVFLLNIHDLDFAALIPKGNYATMCLIGENINTQFVDSFIKRRIVHKYLADKESYASADCSCAPNATLGDVVHPYGDRVVMIGDSGPARLNKDGIGSAYRTSKVAAVTALFRGISYIDFEKGYKPIYQNIRNDNRFGRILFAFIDLIKSKRFLINGVMQMTKNEQKKQGKQRRMSYIMWDMFTGSAPYRDIFLRSLHPLFISRFIWNILLNFSDGESTADGEEDVMEKDDLGKVYHDGELIIRQGEVGDCMYVIQSGTAEVLQEKDGKEIRLATIGKQEVFGEMALFQKQPRAATVRAVGNLRALTIDKRIFLRRVHEDPSFAFLILRKLSQRISDLDTELVRLKT
jgi:hypothetical protein